MSAISELSAGHSPEVHEGPKYVERYGLYPQNVCSYKRNMKTTGML